MEESKTNIDENEDGIRLGRYEISTYNIDKPVETLIKWKNNGKLIIPEFQRGYVWKYNVACKLIDSILLNLPIPGIFVCKKVEDGIEKFYLIDGLQRITTLDYFKNCKYVSTEWNIDKEFRINMKNSLWYQKTYDDLNDTDKENFNDYSISLTIFEINERNESKNLNSMFEIFERINTGSDKLTAQEIRNAIYPGDFLNLIKEYTDGNNNFKALIKNDESISKRKKHQELFLRLVTYYYVSLRYEEGKNSFFENGPTISSKVETLNNFLLFGNNAKIDYMKYYNDIINAIDVIKSFDDTAFYALKRDESGIGNSVHETFSEGLVLAVIKNDFKINITKEKFILWKIDNWNKAIFDPFIENTLSKTNILKRRDILSEVLKDETC